MLAIAILEDNKILRERMVEIVKLWKDVGSVHSFSSNTDFCTHASAENVDVLLADLNVFDGSGLESIAYIAEKNPNSISIVISALSDSGNIIRAISNGAVGYLHKDDNSFEIIECIKMAINGKSPISPYIARKLIKELKNPIVNEEEPHRQHKQNGKILTEREIEVLNLIAKGLSYSECATVLGMSDQTVPVHVRNIYKKLHAKNRSEAVYEARYLGVIE